MDTTTDTPTPSTELVVLDAGTVQPADHGMGSEVTKTLALSAATSAVMFGGYAVITMLLPRVRNWIVSRKKVVPETVEEAKEAVNKVAQKIQAKTEND